MYTIVVRISKKLEDLLSDFGQKNGLTRSQATRLLLEQALGQLSVDEMKLLAIQEGILLGKKAIRQELESLSQRVMEKLDASEND